MKKIVSLSTWIVFVFIAFLPASFAVSIYGDTVNSEAGLGDFTGNFNYSYSSPGFASLYIDLTNTTPSGEGFITGFSFNNPDDKIATLVATDILTEFELSFTDDGVGGAPFGHFDVGLALSEGNPGRGIGVTKTKAFNFAITGVNLDLLNNESFLTTLSMPPGDGQGLKSFITRFQAIGGNSDKVPAYYITTIPEPASILLFGSGLIGLAGLRRKKKEEV